MSSSRRIISEKVEAILVLLLSLAAFLWYAKPQLIYSLYFFYQISRYFFPDVIPNLRPD